MGNSVPLITTGGSISLTTTGSLVSLTTIGGSMLRASVGESIFCSNRQQISKLNSFYKHDTITSFRRSLTDKYTTPGSK